MTVNQRQNGGQWVLLGDYALDPGAGHGVELAASANGSVAADAIRIVQAAAVPLNLNYIHADHLATPQKMTDPAKAVVWDRQARPFGETISITGTADLPLRFPGQYYDSETGLHYNYFRDYDPATGRYVQSDPIGLDGGLNTYVYVGGNPVRRIDPAGLDFHLPGDQPWQFDLDPKDLPENNAPGKSWLRDLMGDIRDASCFTKRLGGNLCRTCCMKGRAKGKGSSLEGGTGNLVCSLSRCPRRRRSGLACEDDGVA